MEALTLDLAKNLLKQQSTVIAGMRELQLRYSKLHKEIHDILCREGKISEADYRILYSKALDGWKFEETQDGGVDGAGQPS